MIPVGTAAGPRAEILSVRSADRGTHVEAHLVAGPAASPRDAFAALAEELVSAGIQPVQERIYGAAEAAPRILEDRRAEFLRRGLDPSLPATFVDGAPADGGEFGGVQVWGVSPRSGGGVVTTLEADGVRGRLWEGPGFRLAALASLRGVEPAGTLPPGASVQARLLFENADAALRRCGLTYAHVVRTWIYLARLLEWYGDFNRVRNARYVQIGFLPPGRLSAPASTGIQGRAGSEECLMDLLALEPGAGAESVPIMQTVRQPAAPSYGSAFSRGVALTLGGGRTIHVSGTASIGADGKTAHVGDREAQCVETLLGVAAVLAEHGAGLEDVCSATLFCKDSETAAAYRSVTRLLGLPEFPTLMIRADVCRPDLLVEMEAVAIRP